MNALVLVDIQNDFLPHGALEVKDGDQILPVVDQLLNLPFDVIVATKDWHPPDHGSFAIQHQKQMGEHVLLNGVDQILWPIHCVQGTPGAEFSTAWNWHKVEKVFYKGTDQNVDSYSTFFDNGRRRSTGLAAYLHEKGVHNIYVAGLATDYCVKYSVLDGLRLGFNVIVVADACRAVNLHEGDEAQAFETMRNAGAAIMPSKDVAKVLLS